MLKKIVSMLPSSTQEDLKRLHFRRLIRRGHFLADEPEINIIGELLRPGDCAVDVGANIGHYTCQFGRIVGPSGRVIAIEPMTNTFAHLAANVLASGLNNVTLLNLAASSGTGVARMRVPKFETGLHNYYRAEIAAAGDYAVLCMPIDSLTLPHRVALMKVDAEGHDMEVLKGAKALISRDHPTLIVECGLKSEAAEWLRSLGYALTRAPDSPNSVARYGQAG